MFGTKAINENWLNVLTLDGPGRSLQIGDNNGGDALLHSADRHLLGQVVLALGVAVNKELKKWENGLYSNLNMNNAE
jgi:hypothetical protein